MSVLTLSTSSATTQRADVVVIGVAKGAKGPVVALGGESVDKAYGGKLAATLDTLGASGGEGETVKLPAPDSGLKAPVVLAVGLGDAPGKHESYDLETLRRAAGTAARALSGTKKAAFALPVEDSAAVGAVTEGALLGAYSFTAYRSAFHDGQVKNSRRGKKDGQDGRTRRTRTPAHRSPRSRSSVPSPATRRTKPPSTAPRSWPKRWRAPAT